MSKKILFLANHFITLYSFRKELISKLLEDGNEVYLSLPEDNDNIYFSDLGCKIIETKIDRRGINPFEDLYLLYSYKKIINDIKPDIIFSYTIKPNIYGTMASNYKYKQVCNITGTGATFLNDNIISRIAKLLYKTSIRNCYKVFFQNTGDKDFFVENGLVKDNYDILPGSGCNVSEYNYVPMNNNERMTFIYIGRVMELKGIDEYLYAAKAIKEKYNNVDFLIAGWNEEDKYIDIVNEYEKNGYVKYLGFSKEIKKILEEIDCVVLPSRGGEGVPNVVLEACATGRPCICSDVNGSNDVITDGVNGLLFEKGNAQDLTDKIESFILMPFEERQKMGENGRKTVEEKYDRQIVIDQYLKEVELA